MTSYSNNSIINIAKRAGHKALSKLGINVLSSKIYPYSEMIKELKDDNLVLLTGGDLYCYEYHLNKNTQFVKQLKEHKKTRIVLWGASIEQSLLNSDSIYGLKLLDRIIARESLSYESLLSLGISENVDLFPDPAFVLEPKPIALPACFSQSEVVGINVSNLVNGGFELNTDFSRNLKILIEHIIRETDMQILLVPHVTWKGQDDRIISNVIARTYSDSKRVHVLKIDELSYCEIRYIISKCRFFIGGRTHSMISAYSMCVPSIALGYSIKAQGIVKDLSLPNELLVDSKKMDSDNILLNAFKFLVDNEIAIRKILNDEMEDYIGRAYLSRDSLNGILL